VADAQEAIRDLNETGGAALRPLARLLLRTESIASSKVEGMQMGARELARAEARLESGGRAGQSAIDILGNIDAMELAIEEAARADRFSPEHIVRVHRRLLEGSSNRSLAGRIRTEQNWIGGNDYNPCGADFVPPPPEHVEGLLADLCEAIEDDTAAPLFQAALVHAQFETIHPFLDGNGRTGRALIHVVLHRRGVARTFVPPISVILAGGKARYIRGLTDYREGRVEAWIEQFSAAAATAARLAQRYLEDIRQLQARWRERLESSPSPPRADAAAWAVIDILPAHPIITAPVAAAATHRSKPQTYRAIEQLEAVGVLEPLSGGRRNRAWEAVGLLDRIAEMES
jgi:Fic family protein